MKRNTYSFEELNVIISDRYSRKVDNASSIKYEEKYYILVDIKTGKYLVMQGIQSVWLLLLMIIRYYS